MEENSPKKQKTTAALDDIEIDREKEEMSEEKELVPLYVCDNLEGLNALVRHEHRLLKNRERLPGLAQRLLSEFLQITNDQERAYIIGKRYLSIMDLLFKISDDKSFTEVRYRPEYRKAKTIVEDLELQLITRYDELACLTVMQQDANELEEMGESVYLKPTANITPPQKGTGDEFRPVSESKFSNTYINPTELYNALMQKANILIVDTRRVEDFTDSCINAEEGHMINIPEDLLEPGLSANTLGKRLTGTTQRIWDKRDDFEVIVLLDWETDDFNYSGSKLERLRVFIVEYDFNRAYQQDPVVLSGGFKEFLECYPSEVTNSYVFLSQTNSEIDELLTIDEVSYPETGSARLMNLKVHTISSFGDVQARVQRDFSDLDELTYGPPARPSRSEGQLPKDFYCSQEGVSPYRSISEESLPREYYSYESITEPPPTVMIESEPHAEVIYEKDIEEGIKSDEDIKSAIESDKTLLLYKARAVKPKQEEEPKRDPRSVIIKNLIEENQDLFKPPTVDRTYKPFKPLPIHQGMVGDGYTGLRNLKNNCYMSCMLQCIKVLPIFKQMFVTSNSYVRHIHKQPPQITTHFATVMKAIWEGTAKKPKIYYPQLFFEKVYELNPVYSKGNHEDTFEFFLFLFNVLSEDCSIELPRPKVMTEKEKSWFGQLQGRSSYLIDLFYYQLKNTKVCWRCQKPNYIFDSDSTVMLSVPERKDSVHLSLLLTEYLRENLVVDYSCSDCKSSATIVNRKSIVLDPEILVIVLKRYIVNNDGTFKKNELEIDFPIKDLVFGNSSYKLYAIPQHSGSMVVGHYYASVLLNDAPDTWVLFNDERVTRYSGPITEAPGIRSSCVGFFYVRQSEIKSKCDT